MASLIAVALAEYPFRRSGRDAVLSGFVHSNSDHEQQVRVSLLVGRLNRQYMIGRDHVIVERPLFERLQFDFRSRVAQRFSEVFPDRWISVERVRARGFGLHRHRRFDRNRRQDRLQGLIARDQTRHQIHANQFRVGPTFVQRGIVSVGNQDRAVVTRRGENGSDFGVDEFVEQHEVVDLTWGGLECD